MAGKHTAGSKPGLIQCDKCGEMYSDTYRRCPFCDEYEDAASDRPASRGGKRLAPSNRRGGGYTRTSPLKVISIVISLAVIVFAVWIVAGVVRPLIQRGEVPPLDPDVSQSVSPGPDVSDAGPDVSPDVSDVPPDVSDPDPLTSGNAADPVDPSPSPDVSSDGGGATGFTLSNSEFTFSSRYPTPVTLTVEFTPAGTTGSITWTSSDPDIVCVDENGKVSPGSKTGTATITAALSNGVTQTCKVHNQISGSNTADTSSSAGTYTVNNPDFTLYSVGQTYQLKVNGYTGNVSWSSSNTGVATVSSDGTCTAAGSGKCTVTGTLDNGSTVTAIVRVNIS